MAHSTPSPARLEAFSDGVIAVIITVMVLEIKVPHANGWDGLRDLAPGLAIYLLSFVFTAVYWLNHQHIVRRTEKAGHHMQVANLGFLFCLSLLPLSTAYVVDKELSGFAVSVYASSLLIIALSFLWLRLAVHGHLNRHGTLDDQDRKGLRNHVVSMTFYVISIVAGYFYPKWVLVVLAAITAIWILPNLSLTQIRQEHAAETLRSDE